MNYYKPSSDPLPLQEREQFSARTLFWLLLLAFLLPFFGPVVAIVVGCGNIRKGGAWALIGSGVGLGFLHIFLGAIVLIAMPSFVNVQDKSKEATVKGNLHAIQLALERFANDTEGMYPHDVAELIEKKYLKEMPENPFTGQPMRAIQLGDEPSEGEFCYEPLMAGNEVAGYQLYGFGSAKTENTEGPPQMKHVIIHLGSGFDLASPAS